MRSDRICAAVLAGLALFYPAAFGAVYPWAFMGGAAVLFFLVFLFPPVLQPASMPPGILLWGMLGLWITFQSLFLSWDTPESVLQLLKWSSMAALFLLCQRLDRTAVIRCFWIIGIFGALEAVYGLIQLGINSEQVLWLKKTAHAGFATGTFMNRNHFAGFLEMAIGVQVGLFFRAYKKKEFWRIVLLSCFFVFSIIALVKSGSRTGIASCLFMLVLLFLWVRTRVNQSGVLVVSFMFCFIALGLSWGWDILFPRIEESVQVLGTLDGRWPVWKDVLNMAGKTGLLGTGLGTFGQAFPLFQSHASEFAWTHAHNDYLEIGFEIGFPAALLLFGLVLSFFAGIISSMRERSVSTALILAGGLAGVCALSVHALSDFSFSIPSNQFYFVFICSLMWRLKQFSRHRTGARSHD